MTSPKSKKIKLSSDIYYTEEEGKHDRIILVENTKFYIQSKKLANCCEYFRAMFSSDFIEKEKETIELKEFKAEQMKMLLDAIFKPEEVDVDEDNIGELVELFVYFQAIPSLIELLKKDDTDDYKYFDQDIVEKLLSLSEHFGNNELKNYAEHCLVVEIADRFETKDRVAKNRQKARDFRFVDLSLRGLDLAEKHQLVNLQDKIDSEIAFEYKYMAHFATTEDEHLKLLEKHRLVKLTRNVESYAMERFAVDPKGVMKKYLSGAKLVAMNKLKETAENYVIGEYEKERYRDSSNLSIYLNHCKKYNFTILKERIRSFLEIEYKKEEQARDNKFLDSDSIVELALTFGLEPIRGEEQANWIKYFNNHKNDYRSLVKKLMKYDLPELKEVMEENFVNQFININKYKYTIEEFCKYSKDCSMEKLKDSVEGYFLAEFHSNHSFKYINHAFECNMQKFKNSLSSFLSSSAPDDPLLMAGREYILNLPDEHHKFILRAILREPHAKDDASTSLGLFH